MSETYGDEYVNIGKVNKEIIKPSKLEIKNLLLSFKDEALELGDVVYDKGTKKWYAIATSVKDESPIAIVIPIESGDEGIKLGKRIVTKSSSFKPKNIFSTYLQSISLEKGGDSNRKKKKLKGQPLYRKKTDDERMKLERNSILTNAGVFDSKPMEVIDEGVENPYQITKNKGVYFS